MNNEKILKGIIASISTFLVTVTNTLSLPVTILLAFMMCDFLTGIIKSIYNKNLSSQNMYKGLAKKMGVMIVLIIAILLDTLLNNDTNMFRNLTAFFYVANEGLSILENLVSINVPIPSFIKNILIQIRKQTNDVQANKDINSDNNLNLKK